MRVGDLKVAIQERRKEFFRVLGEAAGVVPALGFRPPGDDDKTSLGSVFEDTVTRHPDNTMLLFEGRQWTYAEFNQQVNQFARVLQTAGVSRGDTVAVVMENRAEYVLSVRSGRKFSLKC